MAEVEALIPLLPRQFGENKVLPATGSTSVLDNTMTMFQLPPYFREFYEVCGGIALNDFQNGYWLYDHEEVYHRYRFGDINRIEGSIQADVLVIGGNGGGANFVVRRGEVKDVLFLPPSKVQGTVWSDYSPFNAPKIVAPDFPSFLEVLLADFRAFVEGDRNWRYIDSR